MRYCSWVTGGTTRAVACIRFPIHPTIIDVHAEVDVFPAFVLAKHIITTTSDEHCNLAVLEAVVEYLPSTEQIVQVYSLQDYENQSLEY